jgi:hypothetical protein
MDARDHVFTFFLLLGESPLSAMAGGFPQMSIHVLSSRVSLQAFHLPNLYNLFMMGYTTEE